MSTALPHAQKSAGAVIPHSGEYCSDGVCACVLGDGVEEDLHARSLSTDSRAVFDSDVVVRTGSLQEHVQSARCDQDPTGHNTVSMLGFLHVHRAFAVETLGKGRSETRRHMLDD